MADRILLISSGIFHPPFRAHAVLRAALEGVPSCAFERVRTIEHLPADLSLHKAIVLYFHHKRISPHALAALDAYVRGGGGVLAVHSATASFKTSPLYARILGARFSGHARVQPLRLQPGAESGPFDGIGAFTITDEPYRHELQPGVMVHFTAVPEHGKTAPVPAVWTYRYGAGRVCYCMPGHRTDALLGPAMQEILQRGLAWACGR